MRHPYEVRLEELEKRVARIESILKKSTRTRKLLAKIRSKRVVALFMKGDDCQNSKYIWHSFI